MTTDLTPKDRKTIKYEKRMGYVLAMLIFGFGGLFNLFYFVLVMHGYNLLMISLIDIGIIVMAYLVCYKVNLKANRDLIENKKELLVKTVVKKTVEQSYEAGSGTLFIPILGNLFPKLWGQEMRPTTKYFIFSNDHKFEVTEDEYNDLKKGTDFLVHFAKHSATILSISKEANIL